MGNRFLNRRMLSSLAAVAFSLAIASGCKNDKPIDHPAPTLLPGQSLVQKGEVVIPEQNLTIDLPAKTAYQWIFSYAKFGQTWWGPRNEVLWTPLIIEVKNVGPRSPTTVDEAVAAHRTSVSTPANATDDLKTEVLGDGWQYGFRDSGWHFAGLRRVIGGTSYDCEVLTHSAGEAEVAMAACKSVRPIEN